MFELIKVKIVAIGRGLGIIIPAGIVKKYRLRKGQTVRVSIVKKIGSTRA